MSRCCSLGWFARFAALPLLVLLLSGVACSNKRAAPPVDDAPSCQQAMTVVARIGKITTGIADSVAQCEAKKLSPAARRCLVKAQTLDDIAGCVAVVESAPAPPSAGTPSGNSQQ